MKVSTLSRLCLIGAAVFGLMVAWCSGMPQSLSGEHLSVVGGGCVPCDTDEAFGCASLPGHDCTVDKILCMGTGERQCFEVGLTCQYVDNDCLDPQPRDYRCWN